MSIQFDGTDDRVECGTADILQEDAACSIVMRVRFNTLGSQSGTQYARLIHRVIAALSPDGMDIQAGPSGDIGFEIGGTSYKYRYSNTGVLTTATDYVLIVTFDGSNNFSGIHIYINGTEPGYAAEQNESGTSGDTSGAVTYIGNRANLDRALDGTIGHVAIFNRVLTGTEITDLTNGMQLDAIKAMSGLVRYFPMDDGPDGTSADGDTVRDESTNATNATGNDGANNTGLTWKGTSIRVSALTSSFVLPISAPTVSQTPSAQIITGTVTSPVPNVIFSDTGQIIVSTLPPPSLSGSADANFNAPCLVIQSIVTDAAWAVALDAAAQQISSIITDSVETVAPDIQAQQISTIIGTAVPGVAIDAPGLELDSFLPQVSLSGSADANVNAPCLVLTSNICQPDLLLSIDVAAQIINSALGDSTETVSIDASGQVITSNVQQPGVIVAPDISALQAIFSLPGVTITIPGGAVNFNAPCLTMSAILGSVSFSQIYRQVAQARKHNQPKLVNKVNALRRIARKSTNPLTTKHQL